MRDTAGVLPLGPDQKVLLVEQIFPTHAAQNNMYCHPGLLWEEILQLSPNVGSIEIENVPGDADKARVRRRLAEDTYDVIVTTNYYYHKAAAAIGDVVRELMATGKPVVVVANTPYEFAVEPDFPTVLTCFQPGGREHMRAVAEILYGKLMATARKPVSI
jgi:beta-N-acetylhexosaminidase